MVGGPDPSDGEEAGGVGQVRGPLIGYATPEISKCRLGHVDLEDEQRDCDREDAVAERLYPAGAPVFAHRQEERR